MRRIAKEHHQRHTGGGRAEETKEGEGERDGRPITATKAEFNHPKHAVQSTVDEGNV